MHLDRFLQPCADSPPAGADLDSSGDILALDMLAKWGSADAETDWRTLLSASEQAMERSRDLRAATYLTAALLAVEGIRSFCEGLHLIRSLLETYWEELHPLADEDGEFMERSSALFNLTHFHKVLHPLRTAILVRFQPVGRFSLLDIEIAEGTAEAPSDYPGTPPNTAMIKAAFEGGDATELQALTAQVAAAVQDVEAIESNFRERAGLEQAPDMARLRDMLRRIHKTLNAHLPGAPAEGVVADPGGAALAGENPPGDGSQPPRAGVPGEVRSRKEALAALDAVSKYFRTHEPSSPVPLVLARASRLVDMDFLAIMQEIAPDASAPTIQLRSEEGDEY
jgi:type VI secretion system protein ImpA